MPRTTDGIVEAHIIARARVAAGKRPWEYNINLKGLQYADKDNEVDTSFAEWRGKVVLRFRSNRWYTESESLRDLISELSDTSNTGEFFDVFDAIYDLADVERAWIATF